MSGTSIIAQIFVPLTWREDADQTFFVKLNIPYLGPSPSLYKCRLILNSKKVYSVDPDKDWAHRISDNSLSDYFW